VIAPEQPEAATALIDLMLATGGEMITILAGADLEPVARERIEEHVRREYAGIELAIYDGDQSGQLLQIGVE